jgi:hypothetical protein
LNKIQDRDFYYFTFDDDMIYPPDYIWEMIKKIEKYNRKPVVGCGGYIMKQQVRHFYSDRIHSWHISSENIIDRPVHILHTCLTAWHSSALRFDYSDCRAPNMGDVWLAKAAQEQQVPMVLIKRPSNWIQIQYVPNQLTIYGRYRIKCNIQTEVYNSFPSWQIIPLPEQETVNGG